MVTSGYVVVAGNISGVDAVTTNIQPYLDQGYSPIAGVTNNSSNTYYVPLAKVEGVTTQAVRIVAGTSLAMLNSAGLDVINDGFKPFGAIGYNGERTLCQLFVKQTTTL